MSDRLRLTWIIVALCCLAGSPRAAESREPTWYHISEDRGGRMLADYFRHETNRLVERSLADVKTLDDWQTRRDRSRRQLLEMLGLDPLPERTPLNPVVTGTLERNGYRVEKLHFQSRPGLYVTADLYIPADLKQKAPAILYLCGHGREKIGEISYGNKTRYRQHGEWFARHGYVCLMVDTLQLGEIEGLHHGTYNLDMWWWNALGYTPAGVEAWNAVRALDYLETRPEVDAARLGVTGRSGGGATTWWVSALDERVKVAVPVAGITTLANHVIDGCVEGHCDCMYPVNTYRWDFSELAALVAPRPLLIANSDADAIFPLDGVTELHRRVSRIYHLYGADDRLGFKITQGPHKDTPELRSAAFDWFNRFLKGEAKLAADEADAAASGGIQELKVLGEIPRDQVNTTIQETFIPPAPTAAVPPDAAAWEKQQAQWIETLREKCFNGWPDENTGNVPPLAVEQAFTATHGNMMLSAFDFTSQHDVRLRLYVAHRADLTLNDIDQIVLNALDAEGWNRFLATMQIGFANELASEQLPPPNPESYRRESVQFASSKRAMAYVCPRGIGPTAPNAGQTKQTHIRRRFALLGQTLDGMRVWDVCRAARAVREISGRDGVAGREALPLWLQGEREMAGIVLYASLFEPGIARIDLWALSRTHREGPIFLNVLKYLDVPQAVALAAARVKVRVYQPEDAGWEYVNSVAKNLNWDAERFQVRRFK